MPRYLDTYIVDLSPTEIPEAEALAAGTYAVEERPADGPLHVRDVRDGQLERVIYPDAEPSPALAAFQRAHYPGVASWIVSPLVRQGETVRYSIWYLEEDATLGKRVDHENSARIGWSRWYHPDGSYGGAMERRYDENGDSLEVREHLPDGRVLVLDD
jgi:hypothetical protein